MQVTLDPIVAPPELESELEDRIVGWFDGILFQPLFDLLDLERNNSLDDYRPFPSELGSLGIARKDMPQIEASARGALIQYLAGLGISHETTEMLPGGFRPTQECYSPSKVDRARKNDGDRSILVSDDGRVIDGHHQWYAALLDAPQRPIRVIVFNASARNLIRIMLSFPSVVRDNAIVSPIVDSALRSGRIIYSNGAFSGDFNAAISRALRSLGAKFDANAKVYRLPLAEMPYALRGAVSAAMDRSRTLHDGLIKTLDAISGNVEKADFLNLGIEGVVGKVIRDIDGQFRREVAEAQEPISAVDAITVPADFTPGTIAKVRERLTETLELPIKNFTVEQTHKLREMIEANWEKGGRRDRIEEILKNQYGVAERKARFIARQETTRLSAEYVQARAEEIGSTEYIWQTRHDAKVRLEHQRLNGLTVRWDDPPASGPNGEHMNAGEPYGCRCVARVKLNLRSRLVA